MVGLSPKEATEGYEELKRAEVELEYLIGDFLHSIAFYGPVGDPIFILVNKKKGLASPLL